MEKLKLYNSLSRKKEEFKPQDPNRVTMYTCGPTVYGPSHLGHARTYVNFDLLKRVLEYDGYKVYHVLNVTDVHDDMIGEARKREISIEELAKRYIWEFHQDLISLNIKTPNLFPQVTGHIGEIIQMVEELQKKGFAYEKDGSVYFDVSKFGEYGKLSGIKPKEAKSGTRVDVDKHEKEEAVDFALWKKASPGEEEVGAVWDSPWGKGRPGWHIECSVMSKAHLGGTLDIHGGALDLRFPHHENEIAQSEALSGKELSNWWVHTGLLKVEGKKMSKSLGNYIEFEELKEKEFHPLAFRYLSLTTHYRSELNFTWVGMRAAQNALEHLWDELSMWDPPGDIGCAEYEGRFNDLINDDINAPEVIALVWELVKDGELPTSAKMTSLLRFDRILGLSLEGIESLEVPQKVQDLVEERETFRDSSDWERADEIRGEIREMGYMVEDTSKGPKVKKIR